MMRISVLALLTLPLPSLTTAEDTTTSPSNPYLSGCLHSKLEGWTKPRVCNRLDAEGVNCIPPAFEEYLEIRVSSGNWDSNAALGWLAQIVLSELLGVPSTIESGYYGTSRDFYDPAARLDYKKNAKMGYLYPPHNLTGGDCRHAEQSNEEDYVPCAHFIPEYWGAGGAKANQAIQDGLIEPPAGLGVLGQESWFVTKFTADLAPSIVSYHGLQGEANRQKLAHLFKRPTIWKDYCELVSEDNCTTPDETAQRYPEPEEETKMFLEGEYTGHFRYTEANNCTLHPTNCTGHIANYPCGWNSNMESSLYHLNIALDMHNGPNKSPNGYTTTQLKDMWHAANATKEHLMMMWWTPEPHYQTYLNTDAEMQHVMLKPYTSGCAQAREISNVDEGCENNSLTDRVGSPETACGNPAEPLTKLTTAVLYELIHDDAIPIAARSPAYDALRRFQISPVQLEELFALWQQPDLTPRDAVCTWAADNVAFLQSMIPATYPRVTKEEEHAKFGYATIALGCFTLLVVLGTAFACYLNRNRASLVFAQIDFLWILLAGSFLVSLGAVLASVPATNFSCSAVNWLVYVGYSLELVPLMVKVAAINRMMDAAQRMQRIKLERTSLYGGVAGMTLLVVVYMAFWTGFDRPEPTAEYELKDSTTEDGEHIVGVMTYCGETAQAWHYVAVGWNAVLLLGASVLAFQSRHSVPAFNESRTLAFLIYSHCVFVVLRCVTFGLAGYLRGDVLDHVRSLIYSIDQLATCTIYFLPKIVSTEEPAFAGGSRISSRASGKTPFGKSTLTNSYQWSNDGSAPLRNSYQFRNSERPPNSTDAQPALSTLISTASSVPRESTAPPEGAMVEPMKEDGMDQDQKDVEELEPVVVQDDGIDQDQKNSATKEELEPVQENTGLPDSTDERNEAGASTTSEENNDNTGNEYSTGTA